MSPTCFQVGDIVVTAAIMLVGSLASITVKHLSSPYQSPVCLLCRDSGALPLRRRCSSAELELIARFPSPLTYL